MKIIITLIIIIQISGLGVKFVKGLTCYSCNYLYCGDPFQNESVSIVTCNTDDTYKCVVSKTFSVPKIK